MVSALADPQEDPLEDLQKYYVLDRPIITQSSFPPAGVLQNPLRLITPGKTTIFSHMFILPTNVNIMKNKTTISFLYSNGSKFFC